MGLAGKCFKLVASAASLAQPGKGQAPKLPEAWVCWLLSLATEPRSRRRRPGAAHQCPGGGGQLSLEIESQSATATKLDQTSQHIKEPTNITFRGFEIETDRFFLGMI